jgi:glycosyltransferase involved in cell wall biosynthesis
VRAISQAQARPHLYVRGDPVHGFDVYLRALAKEVGCEDRLHFLPTDIPSMMEKLAAQYDLGLAGDTGWTRSRNIALTNKLFTYLLAGLPIAMSEIDAHRTFATDISEPRWLYPVDDAGALARRMDEFLGDPAVLKAARARAFALGRTRYNWEFDSRMLVDVVARALSADTGSRSRPRDE